MEPSERHRHGVIAACAASAGAHAALVPEHLTDERALGVAFIAAALALGAAAVLLIASPGSSGVPRAVVLLLAALIGAYCLNVTTGLLVFALQLIPTRDGRGSLTHKEARP